MMSNSLMANRQAAPGCAPALSVLLGVGVALLGVLLGGGRPVATVMIDHDQQAPGMIRVRSRDK